MKKDKTSEIFLNNYLHHSLTKFSQPLPLLNKINERKEMFLLNYKINFSNQESFGRSIAALIPDMLKKLYLIDNNLSDSCLASLFEALAKCKDGGLSSLYIINNSLGSCSADALANQFLSSKNIKHLKKFTLKNPVMNQKNINIE